MQGSAMGTTVGAAALFLTSACGGHTQADAGAENGGRSPTAAAPTSTGSPSTSPVTTVGTNPSSPDRTMTARNVRLIRDFVALAVEPSATTAAELPFASHVRLGLGRDLRATLARSAVPQASAWALKVKYFRGYVGRFSALELVQRHDHETKSQSISLRGNAFRVSLGDHPHCASPPVPAPRGLGDL